jgi:hypothetical protein
MVAMMTDVLWADASIESLSADYDAVVLRIKESTGTQRVVRCEGYIGYALCGFWDEVIVSRARLLDTHPAIDSALESLSDRFGSHFGDSGNALRNTRNWRALVVELSDGASLEIAAVGFTCE